MERSTIFKNGKPSISIRAIEKPWQTVSHTQVGYIPLFTIVNHGKSPFSYGKPGRVNPILMLKYEAPRCQRWHRKIPSMGRQPRLIAPIGVSNGEATWNISHEKSHETIIVHGSNNHMVNTWHFFQPALDFVSGWTWINHHLNHHDEIPLNHIFWQRIALNHPIRIP